MRGKVPWELVNPRHLLEPGDGKRHQSEIPASAEVTIAIANLAVQSYGIALFMAFCSDFSDHTKALACTG